MPRANRWAVEAVSQDLTFMNSDLQPGLDRLLTILNRNTVIEEYLASLSREDWEAIEAAAHVQGLTLLLHDRLAGATPFVPGAVHVNLHSAYLKATARNMVMLHHAAAMLKALRGRGLEVIVLKGLYLAETVHAGIGSRIFDDIDLLLHRSDLPTALEEMQRMGYELSTWYDPSDPNPDLKHIPPLVKQDAPIVELHWTILEEEEPFTIDVEGLWARSVPADIAGVDARRLRVEDLILHLSLHLTYQHRLAAGVRNMYDIDAVIRKGGVDWTCLLTTTREWGAERVVWLTLRLLQSIAGTTLPVEVLAGLLPVQPDPQVVEEARRQLLHHRTGEVAVTPDLAALGQVTGFCGKVRLVFGRVFIPRRILAREYNVYPKSLKIYLYYFVRLARLVRSYRSQARGLLREEAGAMESAQREQARGELNRWLAGK